ncbi:MAG: F0F1 ATP synthase subunit gamma [Candidatus Saccharimonadales bacterium]
MRRASLIQKETSQITTVRDLTGVFESLASMQVAKVKDKVKMSEDFFNLLWQRYSSIRLDPGSRITERPKELDRNVFVIVSAEASLSGDIDERLIETMLRDYHPEATDIVVIGSHGANQLKERRIPYTRFFKVPESDTYIDVSPVIDAITPYAKIKVFYEEYVSLGVQEIKTIDLYSSIQAMSESATGDEDIMTAKDTIFEPSLDEIAEIMEKGMMALAFSQVILESSLAQAASRFNAMATAKKRAFELIALQKLEFHRAKRSESDRRLREVLIGIKKKKHLAEVRR